MPAYYTNSCKQGLFSEVATTLGSRIALLGFKMESDPHCEHFSINVRFFDQRSLISTEENQNVQAGLTRLKLKNRTRARAMFTENIQEQRPLLHYNRAHNWAAVQKCSLCLWNSCCTVTVPWYCEAAAAALLRPFYGRAGQCRGERKCRIAGLGYCRVMVSWQIQYCRFMVTWYHGR